MRYPWIIFALVLATIVGGVMPYATTSIDSEINALASHNQNLESIVSVSLLICLSLWLIFIVAGFIRNKELDWLSPPVFFGFYYLLTAFGQPIVNYILSFEDTRLRMYVPRVPEYLLLSSLGLTGFLMGVYVASSQFKSRYHSQNNAQPVTMLPLTPIQLAKLEQFAILIMIVCTLALLFVLSSDIGNALSGSFQYGADQLNSRFSYYVLVLVSLMFPPALSLGCYASASLRGKIFTTPHGLLLVLYVMTNALSGDRGMALSAILVAVILQHYLIRRLSSIHLLLGVLSAIVSSALVVSWRSSGSTPLNTISSSFSNTNAFAEMGAELLFHLGSPAVILTNLMRWFPESQDFYYGRTYIDATFSLIPSFLFGGRLERPFLSPTLIYKDLFEAGNFNPNTGYGFALIAEAYMNFGWFGALLIMFVVGLVLQRLYTLANASNHWLAKPRYVTLFVLFPYALRADAIYLVKSVTYAMLLLAVASWWVTRTDSPVPQDNQRIKDVTHVYSASK